MARGNRGLVEWQTQFPSVFQSTRNVIDACFIKWQLPEQKRFHADKLVRRNWYRLHVLDFAGDDVACLGHILWVTRISYEIGAARASALYVGRGRVDKPQFLAQFDTQP